MKPKLAGISYAVLKQTDMNNYFRNLWYEIERFASTDPTITYTVAVVVLISVGYLCLRGNVIKR